MPPAAPDDSPASPSALLDDFVRTADYEEAVELFYERGWTDGLPVWLPTRKLVEAMIAGSGRDRNDSLGPIPPGNGEATIEKLAINAVMGGCKPAYFPVVLAAMEAMLAPEHNLNGVTQTTHPCVSLTIVNGPVARELNFNARDGVFGNGYRANAAVGRALRLALWNLGGAVPWATDMATMSHPGEYAFCIAEEEEQNPWPPFHAERGFAAGSDAATVFACEAPHSVACGGSTPGEILRLVADAMSTLGSNNSFAAGQMLVVLNPRIAQELAAAGWSKNDVREHLWDNARRTGQELREVGSHRAEVSRALAEQGRLPARFTVQSATARIPMTHSPQDIHIIVAGGRTGFAAVLPGWGCYGGYAVTRPIRRPAS